MGGGGDISNSPLITPKEPPIGKIAPKSFAAGMQNFLASG